jgi:hypothetical protein
VTAGKLPEADYAFCDEIFKASSAILNTLLRILNERTFDAGDGMIRAVPLKLCVAASNEWASPDTGKELTALTDRFLLRRIVQPIRSRVGREKLLWTADHTPTFTTTISADEVEEARRAAQALPWSVEAKTALEAILFELAKEGIRPGDRRQFKTVGVVRAFAFLNGADEVRAEHLEIAQHCLWDAPEEQPQKVAQVERLYRQLVTLALQANPPPAGGWPKGKRGRSRKTKACNLAERLAERQQAVLAFVYDFNVPFDNNLAERDIRMLKVQQKVSGCFRSWEGAEAFCTIRSYLSTIRKQGLPVWQALGSIFSDSILMPDLTPV